MAWCQDRLRRFSFSWKQLKNGKDDKATKKQKKPNTKKPKQTKDPTAREPNKNPTKKKRKKDNNKKSKKDNKKNSKKENISPAPSAAQSDTTGSPTSSTINTVVINTAVPAIVTIPEIEEALTQQTLKVLKLEEERRILSVADAVYKTIINVS